MTTNFEIECALMAGASYKSTRPNKQNWFPVPFEWTEVESEIKKDPSGFEASLFTKGTELVISFAGTGSE